MLAEAELRVLAERWQLARIHVEDEYAVLTYRSPADRGPGHGQSPGRVRVVDDRTAYVPLDVEEKFPKGAIVAPALKPLLQAS